MSKQSQVVTLNHGVIKCEKSMSGHACYTFYGSGDFDSNQHIVLYKTHFGKFMTCLQLNFDTLVSQSLEYCNHTTMENDEEEEKEEVLDQQVISEWNHTGYVPCRIVLKSSIYKGRFRLFVLKQWYKRPEYDVKYEPESSVYFTNVDELPQTNWLPCKGAFRIEPVQKELKALLDFQAKCNGTLDETKTKRKPSTSSKKAGSSRFTQQSIAAATAVEKDATLEENYEEEDTEKMEQDEKIVDEEGGRVVETTIE